MLSRERLVTDNGAPFVVVDYATTLAVRLHLESCNYPSTRSCGASKCPSRPAAHYSIVQEPPRWAPGSRPSSSASWPVSSVSKCSRNSRRMLRTWVQPASRSFSSPRRSAVRTRRARPSGTTPARSNPPATRPSTSRVMPGPRQHRALGERRHRQPAVGRLGQIQEHLVVAGRDAVLGDELGVEQPDDRRVALEVAAPRFQRDALEAGGAVLAAGRMPRPGPR